jgi:hypothetical protein
MCFADAPTDRSRWLMLPQQINAYYHPNLNEIVFPAAILQVRAHSHLCEASGHSSLARCRRDTHAHPGKAPSTQSQRCACVSGEGWASERRKAG